MLQTSVPFVFMRGGSSRGPYFKRSDLPEDLDELSKVLVAVVGSGHPFNIDGIGGGTAVTTKVAMLSRSNDPWADIDYFFAQVGVEDRHVDYRPSCGNILVGVGPAALEMGLMEPAGDITEVKIRAVNNGMLVSGHVKTPGGTVQYDGRSSIDGVPGTAAPIRLQFMRVAGSMTGALLPTGKPQETIEGVSVTCMDVAMPMVIARAGDLGVTGYETASELDANRALLRKMEAIRVVAGERMGLGDVHTSVAPKFGLLAPSHEGGTACVRYFMPWNCHPTLAVTGSQCLASCLLAPDTVGEGLIEGPHDTPAAISLEHPMGKMDVLVDYEETSAGFQIKSAGLLRTARKLAAGEVYVPGTVWSGAHSKVMPAEM
ncbi:4-oxalomesaconate tautomerase [Roseibium sp. RKSG952]|uniref:4-oxalomesaconate tautomerase n=1 Tax=Roseibium sp. RKSG952 TaxID=2529384 RepID=UPI0012BCCCA2|nr:4-oxalomesaconate tautomerase [Roseibium sp. RKSG952]MTH99104.1 4-oxalomesaconate tautomerase [Roseibium sp. RKSG952]